MRLRSLSIFLSTLLVGSGLLFGQFDTGGITGTVFDATGHVVPGAKIKLANPEMGIALEATSNESGIYEFPSVRVGTYRMTAEKSGFSMATIEQVGVSISTRTRQDIRLKVGEVSQSIEVAGESPLVESET